MLLSLIDGLEKVDIILASTSPRRYDLLKAMGFNFKVIDSGVVESHIEGEPIQSAIENARNKGKAVSTRFPNSLVVSADTVVIADRMVMGKPVDEADALEMLNRLNGRTHTVVTAFSINFQKYDRCISDYETTEVKFRRLKDEEIMAYINTGEPFDKAGAYAIQGEGAILVEKINGCYYNVVGFPLTKFFVRLTDFCSHYCL